MLVVAMEESTTQALKKTPFATYTFISTCTSTAIVVASLVFISSMELFINFLPRFWTLRQRMAKVSEEDLPWRTRGTAKGQECHYIATTSVQTLRMKRPSYFYSTPLQESTSVAPIPCNILLPALDDCDCCSYKTPGQPPLDLLPLESFLDQRRKACSMYKTHSFYTYHTFS